MSREEREGWSVRPMTVSDVPEASRLHLQAFQGTAGARLGPTYSQAFISWFLTRASDSRLALVLLNGSCMIGFVLGHHMDEERSLRRCMYAAAARVAAIRPGRILGSTSVLRKGVGLLKASIGNKNRISLPGADTWGLVAIAVDSAHAGQGHGRILMSAFEYEAKQRGARSMILSVYASNRPARSLYESCAWRPWSEGRRTVSYVKVIESELES